MNSVGDVWLFRSAQLGKDVTCNLAIATKHGIELELPSPSATCVGACSSVKPMVYCLQHEYKAISITELLL